MSCEFNENCDFDLYIAEVILSHPHISYPASFSLMSGCIATQKRQSSQNLEMYERSENQASRQTKVLFKPEGWNRVGELWRKHVTVCTLVWLDSASENRANPWPHAWIPASGHDIIQTPTDKLLVYRTLNRAGWSSPYTKEAPTVWVNE